MKIQLGHTFDDIVSIENLLVAWQEFLRGKRAKLDVQEFGAKLFENILQLHRDLVNNTYHHGPYQAFSICDPKPRHIHKASVRDRVLHHAIYRILYPFFDRTFISDAYSCRMGKGMHRAINQFRAFAFRVSHNHTRTCWVLKCDIRQFFASVDQRVLLEILESRIADKNIFQLLAEVIGSFSVVPARGLPLGNLTSQLFCNVYLNELDQFIKHYLKAHSYVRYGDDFVILSENREWLEGLIVQIRDFLYERLRLELHPQKLFLKTIASGVDFLGWVHFPDHRVLRRATRRRMMRRIVAHPSEETTQSYLGLLSHGNATRLKKELLDKSWFWSANGD